jgi:hypothetical protein
MTTTIHRLPALTEDAVKSRIQEFDTSQAIVEDAISKLIKCFPQNTSQEEVLLKVTVINDLYGTAIFATSNVADHIVLQNIDELLQKGDSIVVDRIAKVQLAKKIRNNYSFASKYCSWHNRQEYPIYDRFVEQMLWAYRNQDQFSQFRRQDLWEYRRFKEIMLDFRNYYGLSSFDFKDIDKFLWLEGKGLFASDLVIARPAVFAPA